MSKRTRSMTPTVRPYPARGPVVEGLEDRRLMSVGPDAIANASTNDTVFDAANHVLHAVYYDTQAKSLNYKGFRDDGLGLAGQVIDSGGDAGQYLSMTQDPTGALHVAYYDARNGDLKYARRDTAGVWSTQTVDSKNTVGLYPSIALDVSGLPAISYYDKTSGNLKFAKSGGASAWSVYVVASTNDVGRYSSLTLNPDNRFALAFEDTTKGSFLFAEDVPSLSLRPLTIGVSPYHWQITTVDATTVGGGGNISLVFNNGLPAMSYYDAKNGDLKYAERSSRGKWSTTTVAAKNSQGMYGDLAFTYNTNQPAIAYYNKTTDSTLLTYRNLDGTWSFETLITGGGRNLTAADGVSVNGQAPDLYLVWSDTASGGLKVGTF
jgi:hypothetical protein